MNGCRPDSGYETLKKLREYDGEMFNLEGLEKGREAKSEGLRLARFKCMEDLGRFSNVFRGGGTVGDNWTFPLGRLL